MKFWVDGGCKGNHRIGERFGYGSFCNDLKEITRLEWPDAQTNNEAEYRTLIFLLETQHVPEKSTVYTDSALMVGHLRKGWNVKASNLKPLYDKAEALVKRLNIQLVWVPRGEIVERLGH